MANNIDDTNASLTSYVPQARDFQIVQGTTRALLTIRLRASDYTDETPTYQDLSVRTFGGTILRSRGGVETANLSFVIDPADNTRKDVFIPVSLQNSVNPPPNRPITFLYDIWTTDSGGDPSRPLLRGKIEIRERVFNNTSAGNEDTDTTPTS